MYFYLVEFYQIFKLSLAKEIQYKNLEINILLDCARTINDSEKFFVILQICELTTVFYSLEIPYLISVVGGCDFKVVLKELNGEYSIESLEKALDCIFIKRWNTNIASCIKTAIDKFNKFSKFYKTKELPEEQIEMSKEQLYIQKEGIFEINEKEKNQYIKSILNVLRKYIDNDNNNKIEKSIFEIKKLNNIPSKDNLKNLGNILIDNSLTKKIKIALLQETVPKLSRNEIKEISKNIGSIIKASNGISKVNINQIRTFMKLFIIRKEKINLSILDLIFKLNLPK